MFLTLYATVAFEVFPFDPLATIESVCYEKKERERAWGRENTRVSACECLSGEREWLRYSTKERGRETHKDRRLRRINTGERARHKRERDTGESETQRCRARGLQHASSPLHAGGTNCGWEVAYIWNDKPDLIYRFWRSKCVLCRSNYSSNLTTYMCPDLM